MNTKKVGKTVIDLCVITTSVVVGGVGMSLLGPFGTLPGTMLFCWYAERKKPE